MATLISVQRGDSATRHTDHLVVEELYLFRRKCHLLMRQHQAYTLDSLFLDNIAPLCFIKQCLLYFPNNTFKQILYIHFYSTLPQLQLCTCISAATCSRTQ